MGEAGKREVKSLRGSVTVLSYTGPDLKTYGYDYEPWLVVKLKAKSMWKFCLALEEKTPEFHVMKE